MLVSKELPVQNHYRTDNPTAATLREYGLRGRFLRAATVQPETRLASGLRSSSRVGGTECAVRAEITSELERRGVNRRTGFVEPRNTVGLLADRATDGGRLVADDTHLCFKVEDVIRYVISPSPRSKAACH